MINMHSKPVNFKEETMKKCEEKRKRMKEEKQNKMIQKGGAESNQGCAENRNERRPESMHWAWGNRTGSVGMGARSGQDRPK